jgi:hypothetical protein
VPVIYLRDQHDHSIFKIALYDISHFIKKKAETLEALGSSQGYTAHNQQCWDPDPGCLVPDPMNTNSMIEFLWEVHDMLDL